MRKLSGQDKAKTLDLRLQAKVVDIARLENSLQDNARKVIRRVGLEMGCISLQGRGPKPAPDAR